jgi:hypothetical protein
MPAAGVSVPTTRQVGRGSVYPAEHFGEYVGTSRQAPQASSRSGSTSGRAATCQFPEIPHSFLSKMPKT